MDINIDEIVNYETEYRQYIKGAKRSGDDLIGRCPFHDDHNDSFSVNTKTGQWHCFTEGTGGNYVSFIAQLRNIDNKEAYKQILREHGVSDDKQFKPKEGQLTSLTLDEYAVRKKIPADFLRDVCRLGTATHRDSDLSYVRIPYLDENGTEVTMRKRYGNKEFRWKRGSSGKIIPYGLWRMGEVRSVGWCVVCEGESDTQSLWYMNIPALGVAGASLFKAPQAVMLSGLKLYLHIEPDAGGETFRSQMIKKLHEGGFQGEVYTWSCSVYGGTKDPSDLFMKYGKEEASRMIQAAIMKAEKLNLSAADIVLENIPGEPVHLRAPEGYTLSAKGIIYEEGGSRRVSKVICRTPILLKQRLCSLDTGEEKMQIAFRRDGEWHEATFPRSTIFTSRGITALADLGCTVTSENAKHVVRYLEALEAENFDIIERADSTSTFGWKPNNRFIPGIDDNIVLDIDPSQRSFAAAYCTAGTMDGWVELMRPHRARDKFRFILAAAFAPPLLRIIKQRLFFVYNWGGSKGGKTAALKAALSAWGDPERLMVNFNATQVGLERTAAFYCDLPLGIDERQLAGNDQGSLEKIVYMIASGTGKIRGSKTGGIQTMHTWRTVALATGEVPLSTETTQTGVSTRVIEIYGGPFKSEESASRMHQRAGDNCGWAGPEFVRRIIAMDEDEIRDRYERINAAVYKMSGGQNGSHCAGIAAVALADILIDEWFFEGKDSEKTAMRMAENILREQLASTGDVNENALQFVTDWVLSNKERFGEKAFGQCYGFLDSDRDTAWIYPSILSKALTDAGYSFRKTMRFFADNNYIETTKLNGGGVRYQVIKRFDGRPCKFVKFNLRRAGEDVTEETKVEKKAVRQQADPEYQQGTLPGFSEGTDGFIKLDDVDEELPFN